MKKVFGKYQQEAISRLRPNGLIRDHFDVFGTWVSCVHGKAWAEGEYFPRACEECYSKSQQIKEMK
jgi:hypothetical protein